MSMIRDSSGNNNNKQIEQPQQRQHNDNYDQINDDILMLQILKSRAFGSQKQGDLIIMRTKAQPLPL